jgi:hypothetical protein
MPDASPGATGPLSAEQADGEYRALRHRLLLVALHTTVLIVMLAFAAPQFRSLVIALGVCYLVTTPVVLHLVRRSIARRVEPSESLSHAVGLEATTVALGSEPPVRNAGLPWKRIHAAVIAAGLLTAAAQIFSTADGRTADPPRFPMPLAEEHGPWLPPTLGTYRGTGTTVKSVGFRNQLPTITRTWVISADCSRHPCHYMLTRQTGEGAVIAPLTETKDGWTAEFAPRAVPCKVTPDRRVAITWGVERTMVLRFNSDRRTVTAGERTYANQPGCGYGQATRRWTASRTTTVNR